MYTFNYFYVERGSGKWRTSESYWKCVVTKPELVLGFRSYLSSETRIKYD